MKALYIILLAVIIVAAKNFPLKGSDKKSRYFIMVPHTPEQCRKVMEELKSQNNFPLSNFDFGCNYTDHTIYGVVEGTSESAVRSSLPQSMQLNAKIKPVDMLSAAEIEKLHLQNASGNESMK